MFFVFEGVDGAGKTTQLQRFSQWLESSGHSVVACKDPGSTQLGEQLRSLLLGTHQTPIHMRTEMMMFTTARTQLVEQIIKPALATGKTVVLDRYILSTVVYQGYAGKLNPDDIWSINRIATDRLMPDVTFVLDLDIETAEQRLGSSLDRMESRGRNYFEAVRAGFIAEVERCPENIEIIDASRTQDAIQSDIQERASRYLARKSVGRL
jgi:dTMP kinase